MARPRRPLLSRDRIAVVALAVIDADGLEALSTRRLATELGVSGPSLYNHVSTKDDLLDAVVDIVLREVDTARTAKPSPRDRDWAGELAAWARSYRTALAAHPNIVPALVSRPGNRRQALRISEADFDGLVDAGWPPREATRIGAIMRYFVIGTVLGSFAGGVPEVAALYETAYPRLDQAHLLSERQQRIDDDAFETGLAALLEGLGARYRRLTDAPHD